MSRVSYFQRFSQRENHATNNTLLLLRYFYEVSPRKLQKVMNAWIDVPVDLGLTFQQQVRRAASVPDGLIKQSPLEIFFETKHGSELWRDQIDRHITSISPADKRSTVLLIGLTTEPSSEADETAMRDAARAKEVIYRGLTFSRVLEDLRATCAPHDEDLLRVLDDYQDFLEQEGLLDQRRKRIAVIPCGTSIAENLRFNLYYEPPSRPCRRGVSLIGVYQNKAVRAVGRIAAVGVFSFKDGQISNVETEVGSISQDQKDRLTQCIAETKYYDLRTDDLRVYFVEKFVATDLKKVSSGGVQSIRYLDLDDLISDGTYRLNMSIGEIAESLKGRTFE